MNLEIFDAKYPTLPGFTVTEVSPHATILSVKRKIAIIKRLSAARVAIRLEPHGQALQDEQLVSKLKLPAINPHLYYRDLGPQISRKTAFMLLYFISAFIYSNIFERPAFIYGTDAKKAPVAVAVRIAHQCYLLHYMKRFFEAWFVHRYSKATMSRTHLFMNCCYLWGFSAFIAYSVNHPLYTPPGFVQVFLALCCFVVSELGNLVIHLLLRHLRPLGSRERKIPVPGVGPLTQMFNLVSCPNYTYELTAWLSFTAMTMCLPAALFTLTSFLLMKYWADEKHRNYRKEFPNYPRNRKPMVPFLC